MRHLRGVADTLTAQGSLAGPARLTATGELLTGSSAGMERLEATMPEQASLAARLSSSPNSRTTSSVLHASPGSLDV